MDPALLAESLPSAEHRLQDVLNTPAEPVQAVDNSGSSVRETDQSPALFTRCNPQRRLAGQAPADLASGAWCTGEEPLWASGCLQAPLLCAKSRWARKAPAVTATGISGCFPGPDLQFSATTSQPAVSYTHLTLPTKA